jgi:BMFP domain-containing protein YqiC
LAFRWNSVNGKGCRAMVECELDSDVREVGRENRCNSRPFRVDGVDVLLKCYVTRQLETVDVVGHSEHDVERHVLKGGRLPSTDLTGASLIRC